MKVKVISRSTGEHTKERSQDLQRVFHNYDPSIRTQGKAVEYVRALNAAKLDKIFARPFVGAMDGHIDAISCMAKNPNHLTRIFSGSMDGDIRLWDIASRRTVHQFPGHQGTVRGLAVSTDGRVLVSCGTDCSVRLWSVSGVESIWAWALGFDSWAWRPNFLLNPAAALQFTTHRQSPSQTAVLPRSCRYCNSRCSAPPRHLCRASELVLISSPPPLFT